jgi:hypothetical protein
MSVIDVLILISGVGVSLGLTIEGECWVPCVVVLTPGLLAGSGVAAQRAIAVKLHAVAPWAAGKRKRIEL